MRKRIISFLLAIVMVVSLMPTMAFAETEEPITDELITDELITDELITDELITDELITDEPTTDEPTTDELITDEPTTDEPTTDEPTMDELITDVLAMVKLATEKPATANLATVTTWGDLQPAIDNAEAGATIQLGANLVAEDGDDPIKIDKELTLDLNGYRLDANYDVSYISSILVLKNGADLTIMDSPNPSAEEHDIFCCNGEDYNYGHWFTYQPEGYDEEDDVYKKHVTITGGLITGTYEAAAVYLEGGAKCTLKSGTIAGNVADSDGGGVFVDGGATFIMTGGTISYNDASYGGGVAVGSRWTSVDTAKFILNGGSVSNNVANSDGGGVYVSAYPKDFAGPYFTMTGGSIKNNTAPRGGGVALEDCDAYSYGSEKHATIMEMTGGSITNNYCGTFGGGVCFCAEYEYGSVMLGGTAVISGNWRGDQLAPEPSDPVDNFHIGITPMRFFHDGGVNAHKYVGFFQFDAVNAPTDGMDVGVTLLDGVALADGTRALTAALDSTPTDITSYFHSDDLNYQVQYKVNSGDTTTYQIVLVDADVTKPHFDPRSGKGMVLASDTGIPTTNPTREGFKFLGWYDESGDQIHDGTNFVAPYTKFEAGSVYYAYWEKQELLPPTFYVYDDDVGAYVEWKDCVLGENNVPTSIPVQEGYKFLGWFDKETGGNQIHDGEKFVNDYTQFEYNGKYFAHWVEDVPAKFFVNGVQLTGGDLDENDIPKNLAPAREYCGFGGWYDKETGGNQIHDGEKFVGANTEFTPGGSYYARWFVLDADGKLTENIPLDQPLKFFDGGEGDIRVTIGAKDYATVDAANAALAPYGITAEWRNYTPKAWTITLEDACISVTEGIEYSTTTYSAVTTATWGTTFVLNGKNTITAKTDETMTPSVFTGLCAAKALTFSGDGSLLIDLSGVTGAGVVKRGIWAKNTLTNSATLTTKGTNKAGIFSEGAMTNSGAITAEDTTCGVFTADNKALTNNGGTIVATATDGYRGVRVGGNLTVKAGSVRGISGGKKGAEQDGISDSCGVFVKKNINGSGTASVVGEVSGEVETNARGIYAIGTITISSPTTISGKANATLTVNNHNYGVSTGGGFAKAYRAVNTEDAAQTLKACNLEPTDKTQPVVVSDEPVQLSTYELVLNPPKSCTRGQTCDASVELKVKEMKDAGYASAQIQVDVTGPATPTILNDKQDLVSDEYLGDENFALTKKYDQTYSLKLTFDKVGDYTVTFTVVDVNGTPGENVICTDKMTLNVSKPALTGTPTILSGKAEVGETLTATVTDLSDKVNVSYQWCRCASATDAGTPIKDATGTSYTLTKDDHGKYIRFRVTAASASEFGGYVSSAPTDVVKMNSIYEISMDAKDIVANVATETSFTIEAKEVNELDYESVRVKFAVTAKPAANAKVKIYETADASQTDLVGGFWKADGMALAKNAKTTTQITMFFNTAGDYTVKLTLVDKNKSDAEICSLDKKITVEKPDLTGTPTILGEATVGETLTASTTDLSDVTNVTYEWWSSNAAGEDGNKIAGATNSTYTLVAADRGKYITVVVVASDTSLYKGSVRSAATAAVQQHTAYKLDVTAPTTVAANEQTVSTETSFTIAAQTQYDIGYDSVSVKVDVTQRPGPSSNVIINDTEAATPTNLAGGYWKPDGMALAVDGKMTTPITMLFDTAGDYIVKFSLVDKDKDDAVICYKEINVTVQEHSTYKFTSTAPTTCGVEQECSNFLVTVAADSVKSLGYEKARINVEIEKKPAGAEVEVNGKGLESHSYLGSVDGFELTKDGSMSVPFALSFDTTGKYTVKLTLVDLNNDAEICEATADITVKPAFKGTVTVDGAATVNEKLTAVLSDDFEDKTNITYQWYRCASATDAGTPITVATKNTYTLKQNDKGYYFKVIVTATADSECGGYVCSAAIGKVKLQFKEKPTITVGQHGEHPPYFGERIMASIANTGVVEAQNLVNYQWFRCDTAYSEGTPIEGATAVSYTPTNTDLGKYIYVQITGKEECPYGGPKRSDATKQVKMPPADAPIVTDTNVAVTDATVTLPIGTPNAYEYSTDGKTWSDSNEFTGLTAATQYTYYIREKGTDITMPSEVAKVTVYTAPTTPAADEGYGIDYTSEKLSVEEGYQVSTSTDFGTPLLSGSNLEPGTTYYVRKAANGDIPASLSASFTTLPRPAAPESAPALGGKTDTSVTIKAEAGQEYSIDGGTTWVKDGDADGKITFTGLKANTPYNVITRQAAVTTEGSERFAGETSTSVITTKRSGNSEAAEADPVDIINGQIKRGDTGDTVVEVKNAIGADIEEYELNRVATAINGVLNNKEVASYTNIGLEKATEDSNAYIVADLKAQTTDTTAKSNVTAANITKYLNVELVSATVDTDETVTVTAMTFDVTPMATITVAGSSGQVTLTTEIDNDDIKGTVTFLLPVDSSITAETAAVYHEGEFIGNQPIETANGAKYVKVSTTSFSKFRYITLDRSTAGAEIGDTLYASLRDAVSEVKNGQTITLLKNASGPITVSREVKFTVDDNGKTNTAKISAGKGYTVQKSGNTYTFTEGGYISSLFKQLFDWLFGESEPDQPDVGRVVKATAAVAATVVVTKIIVDRLHTLKTARDTAAAVTPIIKVDEMPMVAMGSIGDAVKTLQTKLNKLGYNCGEPDGVFGNDTHIAVCSFQAAKGLTADGVVGRLTWDALL